MKQRLVIGMSGASGAPLTIELLEQLMAYKEIIETHLIVTKGARQTLEQETSYTIGQLEALADVVHDNSNIGAAPASGSFQTMGMVIVPCSMKTVAGIVSGYSDNLLLRAADVTLKERRKLVLVAREAPMGTIHLRNLHEISQLGAVVIPPVLSYYNHPKTIADCNRHIVGKLLDQFQIEGQQFHRWEGEVHRPGKYTVSQSILQHDITATVEKLDYGLQVSIFGGQQSHIGAVTVVDEQGKLQTTTLSGHKEGRISEDWAAELYAKTQEPVSVVAGVHYDNLNETQLLQVIQTLTDMKKDVLQSISTW